MIDPGERDEADDVTLWAGRLRAWPVGPPADDESDETVRSRRRSSTEAPSSSALGVAEDTVRSAPTERPAATGEPNADATVVRDVAAPGRNAAGERDGDTTVVGGVAGQAPAPADAAEDTAAGERRRRAATRAPVSGAEAGTRREAHAPDPLRREPYAPRTEEPVRVARAAANPTARVRDVAAVAPRRTRGGLRLVILAAAIVTVVTFAAVGVALLLG